MSQASSGAATTNRDKMSAVTGGVWPATGQPLAVGLGSSKSSGKKGWGSLAGPWARARASSVAHGKTTSKLKAGCSKLKAGRSKQQARQGSDGTQHTASKAGPAG